MKTAYEVLKGAIEHEEPNRHIRNMVVMNVQGHALRNDDTIHVDLSVWTYKDGGVPSNGVWAITDYISEMEEFLTVPCDGYEFDIRNRGDHMGLIFDLKRCE